MVANRSVRLLDRRRQALRPVHYSLPTEEAHVYCTQAFTRCHGLRHSAAMGGRCQVAKSNSQIGRAHV